MVLNSKEVDADKYLPHLSFLTACFDKLNFYRRKWRCLRIFLSKQRQDSVKAPTESQKHLDFWEFWLNQRKITYSRRYGCYLASVRGPSTMWDGVFLSYGSFRWVFGEGIMQYYSMYDRICSFCAGRLHSGNPEAFSLKLARQNNLSLLIYSSAWSAQHDISVRHSGG